MVRRSLAQSPEMRNPALSGEVDPVVSDSVWGSFRLETYSTDQACFLGQANIPPDVALSVGFRMEGYRSVDDFPERGHVVTTHDVHVLDSQELALRWDQIELHRIGNTDSYAVHSNPIDRSMYNTGLRVCFDKPPLAAPDIAYLLLRADPKDMPHNRIELGWRIVQPNPKAGG